MAVAPFTPAPSAPAPLAMPLLRAAAGGAWV